MPSRRPSPPLPPPRAPRSPKPREPLPVRRVPIQVHPDAVATAARSFAERDQILNFRVNEDEARKLDELVAVVGLPTRACALRALISAGHDSTIEAPVRFRLSGELAKDQTAKEIDERVEELAAVMLEKASREDEEDER